MWDCLTWLARREGFAVDRAGRGPAASLTSWDTRRISISPGLSPADAMQALLHELGHVLAHGDAGRLAGTGTAGCRGIQKVEADSVAFIVSVRLGADTTAFSWPYIATWAGSDPRARPEAAVLAAAGRITQAAAAIIGHLDVTLFAAPEQDAVPVPANARDPGAGAEPSREPRTRAPAAVAAPDADLSTVLEAAESFYLERFGRSWAPGYLVTRGLTPAMAARWRIGYAPGGWTALVSHLRRLGHQDTAIQAAGLGRRSCARP